MKGLYRRGKIWWMCYKANDGTICRESTKSDSKRVAELLLHKRKNEVAEGNNPELKIRKNYTFGQLAEEYMKWSKMQRSFSSKRFLIKRLVGMYGDATLRSFTPRMLEQLQATMLDEGKKPATANRLLATIKHAFTKAVDWNMVEESVLKTVRSVKFLKENNRRLRYLSADECRALIDVCDDHLKPIVIMGLNTGMRRGEMFGLTWDNVDLKHGFIHVTISKNGERREIPINTTLRETLQKIIRRIDVPHVFYDPSTGKPYTDLKKSFKTACRKAGIQDFTIHDMRHTFASQLVMKGVDITTVKELLGHKTLIMTLRYSHLAPAHKAKAVELLDAAINDVSAQLVHNGTKKG